MNHNEPFSVEMALNPLSNPKGVKLLCELCQKPAFEQCTACRVTYYCSLEHQKADWLGIHEKICQLLIPLRTPIPFVGSEEDREHQRNQRVIRQKQMIELCRTTGQKFLFEGKYDCAVPAALAALKFAIQVYGLSTIELVPSYLILGEASIGLNKQSQANEYLSQAQWTVLKTPECGDEIKSRLYRNLGLLEAARKNYSEALGHLANDVYHSSCAYGTDNIATSGGYFHMANVFYRQNKLDIAFSLYNQVIDIWHDHLSKLVEQRTATAKLPGGILQLHEEQNDDIDVLNEAQEAEAIQVVNAIMEIRQQQAVQNASTMCKVYYTVAMLYYVLQDPSKAGEFVLKAQSACDNILSGDAGMTAKITMLTSAVDSMFKVMS